MDQVVRMRPRCPSALSCWLLVRRSRKLFYGAIPGESGPVGLGADVVRLPEDGRRLNHEPRQTAGVDGWRVRRTRARPEPPQPCDTPRRRNSVRVHGTVAGLACARSGRDD